MGGKAGDDMSEAQHESLPLHAESPFELRLNMSRNVTQSFVKKALGSGNVGFIHSFTTGSTVDGPGVRVVAWTAGCQWKCLYCHNPDTWNMMNGMPIPLERAVEELRKYRHGLKIMSGGLTLSGGEPLMQDRFAVKLFTAAKAMGVHTAIETNGALGARLTDEELKQLDLVLLGIKTWGSQRHLELTGKDIAATLLFAQRLARLKKPVWIRFVLVPGLTDDADNLQSIADFVAALGNVERVEVLPFHQMGRFKWTKLKLDYKLNDVQAPAAEQCERACEIFRGVGLQAY
jgi:pyruvate formate lyase activating enzyme